LSSSGARARTHDLDVARRLSQEVEHYAWAVAFHAQQAAEKFLKAFLVRWQIEFPKTHDLQQILSLVAKQDRDLAGSLRDVVTLTPYGVQVRYPGQFPDVTPRDAREALELARQVRDRIREVLG